MIEIKMNKELGEYEPKQVGPFTLRQSICVAGLAVFGYLAYSTVKPKFGEQTAYMCMLVPAVVAWLFGWYKPYGLHFEEFFKTAFIYNILAPNNRKYKCENYWSDFVMKLPDSSEKSYKKHRKITLKNSRGDTKKIFTGFSWDTLFLGFIVPAMRKDWKNFALLLISFIITCFACVGSGYLILFGSFEVNPEAGELGMTTIALLSLLLVIVLLIILHICFCATYNKNYIKKLISLNYMTIYEDDYEFIKHNKKKYYMRSKKAIA